MYLKSIQAYGFKSFADKIEINLGKNINGIVGPNGSGKSNVVDAVRWVLGEQSIKSLRGDSATDIIFSGSKSRKPLNRASVTLTFDNSDMYLPINYNEISLKRVIYKNGENEYYLNNERCRLKDITNLLTDSGADKESFNIISQGKIDEILSTKPSDRRVIFESASGVLKYKKRKVEALKKIERTDVNLNRVNDIISELAMNMTPLQKQSEDAKKYLEYKDKLKNIEISLAVHDINQYNDNLTKLNLLVDKLTDEVTNLSSDVSTSDIDLALKKDELKKLENKINENHNVLMELIKSIEKIAANIKVLNERKKYATNHRENSDNILSLKEKKLKLSNEIRGLKLDIDNLNIKQLNIQNKLSSATKILQNVKEEKNTLISNFDDKNKKIMELKYKIDYLEKSIASSNSIPSAIKSILNHPNILGVHNIIAKLLKTDDKYNTSINIALAGAANYLVVDTTKDAKAIVNYLKENNLGRATLYPLDVIKPRVLERSILNELKELPGFIDVAANLVDYDELYQNIIMNVLGNVLIVDNIDNASLLSKKIGNKYKIVTLDGQVVNVGGSITGGSITKSIIKEKIELNTFQKSYTELLRKKDDLDIKINDTNAKITINEQNVYDLQCKLMELTSLIDNKNNSIILLQNEKEELESELADLESITNATTDKYSEEMLNTYYAALDNQKQLEKQIENYNIKKQTLEEEITEIEKISKTNNSYVNAKEKEIQDCKLKINTYNVKMDSLLNMLNEDYNITYDNALNNYLLEIEPDLARVQITTLKQKIKELSSVNIGAIEEYKRINDRYKFFVKQKEDLNQAKATLNEIIGELDSVMKEKFLKTFEEIRLEFKNVFVQMFGGGKAELILTDPNNILETGIEIQAVPSGKNLKSLSLLSGGEKTFTAISLLFAILNVRPVPFCLLDEVEAALDDANVESFGNYLYKYRDKTQFILITHKKKTMEFADILYGITMQESGVSKLVSVKLEDVKK